MEREGQKMVVSFDFNGKPSAQGSGAYLCPMHPKVTQEKPGICPICKMALERRRTAGEITGRFTSLSQGAMEYPLDLVTYSPPKLHFALGGGNILFDGAVSGESITGSFREGDDKGAFSLRRVKPLPPPYHREEVTFQNGSVTLAGTLLVPLTPGPHPGIILAHGSGGQTRWGTPFFFADHFARHGIAALVFDKRGSGSSTGDWKTASHPDLAEDVIAGVRLLLQRKEIRPDQIGIYGHSEGAMIAPLVASRSQHVAFIIAADGFAGSLAEQELYRVHNNLIDNGLNESEAARALAFYSVWLNVAATGKGWDLLNAILPKMQKETWFPTVAPPPRDNWVWKWYPLAASYDASPYWERVTAPVLLVYGEEDRVVNPATSMARIDKALRTAGNRDYTELLIPRAEHNLTIHSRPGQPFAWWHVAPGYPDLLTAWVLQRVGKAQ